MAEIKSWTMKQCQTLKIQVDESVAPTKKLEDKLRMVIAPIGLPGRSGSSGATVTPSPIFEILNSIQNTLTEHNFLLENLLNRIDI